MNYFLALVLSLLVYMSLWFLFSLLKKRNDVADIAWGLGFVLMAWLSFYFSSASNMRSIVVCLLVSIWGLRLAWHIHNRNKGRQEDYRYQKWRTDWGKWFYVRSFFQVYILQGLFLFLIALPVFVINKNSITSFGALDFVGLFIWLVGFYFEVVGDLELARFTKNLENKGKLLRSGLWFYTRHPNYFGEVTQWWGIWLIAFSVPNGLVTVIGPIMITFLILKISGIPLLEKKMESKPEFAEYKRTTSIFIPLPKK
jgi:steroid 5-alpha reductase family enzyme